LEKLKSFYGGQLELCNVPLVQMWLFRSYMSSLSSRQKSSLHLRNYHRMHTHTHKHTLKTHYP